MLRLNRLSAGLLAGMLIAVSGAANAMNDGTLGDILEKRLLGDRSGACFAAAVIEGDSVARAWRCADPADLDRVGPDVAFEIGSVTKTMTAILLADLVARGEASLDDPLADYLPEDAAVPEYEGQPILLRHMVTHTSGLPRLPSRLAIANPQDPYAGFGADALLASLQDVTLAQAPGEAFEYSNFGTMLLSLALARQAGMDFERLLEEKLFAPLGMEDSYVASQPEGLRVAQGHLPDARQTAPWTFVTDLAGAGGVHATLDDMVRYAHAQLGGVQGATGEAIDLAQQPVETAVDERMAMGWVLNPAGERLVHWHNGGTGGFASMLMFDREAGRAVVLLADTALYGDVDAVAAHLFDDSRPLGGPPLPVERPEVAPAPSPEELGGYAGTYPLMPGFDLAVREQGGRLHAQATGQGEFPLDAVAEDVFEAAAFGIEIRFGRDGDGNVEKLDLHQGGHVLSGERQ